MRGAAGLVYHLIKHMRVFLHGSDGWRHCAGCREKQQLHRRAEADREALARVIGELEASKKDRRALFCPRTTLHRSLRLVVV